jgi:hypothetical protein
MQVAPPPSARETMLVELTQWLGRIMQYSANHPACADLGGKVLTALGRVLDEAPFVSFGILKDGVMLSEDVAAWHPSVRQRLAPHLHARGVLSLRFAAGVSLEELTAFMEVLTLPAGQIFDDGGIGRVLLERGIARVQIEELEHDVTTEEREAQKRRRDLGEFFAWTLQNLRAERALGVDIGRLLLQFLEHPEIAVALLEEHPLEVCDAVAALCLMVRQEETATDTVLFPKLRAILLALSPAAQDRVVVGFPSLVGDFRSALGWALQALSADDLARVALPSARRRANELDVVFYALGAAVPHDGERRAALRRLALYFYDLPTDDSVADELLANAARSPDDFDSYRRERECLEPHARAALARRAFLPRRGISMPPAAELSSSRIDARRVTAEVVKMSSRTRRFDRLCTRLANATNALGEANATEAVIGVLQGLSSVAREEWRELASQTMKELASTSIAPRILGELEAAASIEDGAELEDKTATIRMLVALSPEAVLDHLEVSQSRKMRRILLDALAQAGPGLLPLVRAKLQSTSWFVVRNAVILLPRLGGTARDLTRVARHPNEKVRLEIARALHLVPADSYVADIAAAYLGETASEVRIQARSLIRAELLGELLGPTGILVLERIAGDEAQPEESRQIAIEALGRCPDDAAATALFQLIQPRGLMDRSTVRDFAAVALRRSPAPGAAALFQEGLKSSAWRVRKSCERAAEGGGS